MSKYNESVLTTAGLALATRAFRGQTKFTITRTATTADTLTEAEIKGLVKLPNEKQTGTLTSSLDTPDGDERIAGTKVLYTNEKVTKGYGISTIGLYAKEEGKDTEFLYAVTLAAEPEYMPDFGDKVLFEFGMSIFVMVGQKQNVTIQLNPQSLATIEYVDKAIADHQVVFPSDLAYLDKDQTVTGKWKFGQNPVDKDGDEYVTKKVVADSVKWGDQVGGRNLIVHSGELEKQFLDASGKLMKSEVNNTMAEMISVTPGEWLTFQQDMTKGDQTFRWSWYDSNKLFIDRSYNSGDSVIRWQVPDDAYYIRVSYPNTGHVWLKRGKLTSDWTPAPEDMVSVANSVDWQQQALFNKGSYNIGSASTDYRTYVEANFSTAGVRYVRLQNSVDKDENGQLISAMDTHLISEGGGWYYAEGISMKGEWLFRRWSSTSDTGWKVAVDNISAANFQKTKLTLDNGGPTLIIMADGKTDTNATIFALDPGLYTVYIQGGAINNPSSDALRGTIFVTGGGFGNGSFASNMGDSYNKFYFVMDTQTGVHWFRVPKAAETDPLVHGVLHDGADLNNEKIAGSYSNSTTWIKNGPFVDATYVRWDVTVSDNGNAVTQHAYLKNGESAYRTWWKGSGWGAWQITTPSRFALDANTLHRNTNTGVISEKSDFTQLTVNGGKSVATRDDLKSIEDASWHTITGKSDSLSAYTCMYRKNNEQKYVDLVLYGTMGIMMDPSDPAKELLDLSGIISALNGVKGKIACPISAATGGDIAGYVSVSGTKILFSWQYAHTILYSGNPIISAGNDLSSPFFRVTFD